METRIECSAVTLRTVSADMVGSGRMGTASISLEDFAKVFGPPERTTDEPDKLVMPDGAVVYDSPKVTAEWFFDTPRGVVCVRDYWWNGPRELSIASTRWRAALWVAAFLRRKGIEARTDSRWNIPQAEGGAT